MTRSESTSRRLASLAARGIKAPFTLTMEEIRAVCGSCLTQHEAEAAGPPMKAWGYLWRGTLIKWAGGYKPIKTPQVTPIRVEIRAIPPARKPAGKHGAARKGK